MTPNPLSAIGAIALVLSCTAAAAAQDNLDPRDVMDLLGARGEAAFTPSQVAGFGAVFFRMDRNRDGRLSAEEYVGGSRHFAGNAAGATGFIRASDADGDGHLSLEEYVQNRIITDEAKAIFTVIDSTTDWASVPAFRWEMAEGAFVGSALFPDTGVAGAIFDAMDRDGNAVLTLPEYLVVYGQWARAAGLP